MGDKKNFNREGNGNFRGRDRDRGGRGGNRGGRGGRPGLGSKGGSKVIVEPHRHKGT